MALASSKLSTFDGVDIERSAHDPPTYTGASTTNLAAVVAPTLSRFRSHQSAIADAQLYHDTISLAPVSSRVSRAAGGVQASSSATTGIGRAPSQRRDPAAAVGWHDHDEEDEEHALGSDVAYHERKDVMDVVDTEGKPNLDSQTVPPLPAPIGEETKQAENDLPLPTRSRIAHAVLPILRTLATPATLSVILAIPVSLVSPLKALFVHVDGWTGGRMPNAPDGNPPLSFLLDVSSEARAPCPAHRTDSLSLASADLPIHRRTVCPTRPHAPRRVVCASRAAETVESTAAGGDRRGDGGEA